MPGRSASLTIASPRSTRAVVMSTVMPGQLATRADAPVIRLKNVDLPVFGGPTTATMRVCGPLVRGPLVRQVRSGFVPRFPPVDVVEQDGARVGSADHELGRPDAKVQRAAERRAPQQRHLPAGGEAERRHPLARHPRGGARR